MRTLTKKRITLTVAAAAAAFMLATSASIMFAPIHAESSIRVTQSTNDGTSSLRVTQSNEDGLEVKCEGNLNCEITGEDTVVATSEDNNTASSAAVITSLNQSNIIQSSSDYDNIIEDEKDLGAMIEGTVDRLLDDISAELTNSLSLFRVAY